MKSTFHTQVTSTAFETRRNPLAAWISSGAAPLFSAALLAVGCQATDAAVGGGVQTDGDTAERLQQSVAWLADDAQGGRRAGTPNGLRAGRWIAEQLAAAGLEPAGEGGWFQEFQVPLTPRDGGASALTSLGEQRRGAEQLTPLFCSSGGRAQGPLAFAGYGVVNGSMDWDSYGDAKLAGAVVMIVRGAPRISEEAAAARSAAGESASENVEHGSGWGNSGSLFLKVMNARRQGAVAVIVAQHPADGEAAPLAFDRGRGGLASLPVLMVSTETAVWLLPEYVNRVHTRDQLALPGPVLVTERAVAVEADVERGEGPATNVLGRLAGIGSGPTVVIGAHYDHLGLGGTGSLHGGAFGEIHNGADDNASGTAVVIEMARLLAAGPPPAGDVICALWSGEELGLLGSEYWSEHPTVPLDRVGANINLDMVGRAGDGHLEVLGAGTSPPFAAWLEAAGPAAGLELSVSLSGQGMGGSDHQTFIKRAIPALHFFSGTHPDYHRPSDDTERFEAGGAQRVTALSLDLMARMQAAPQLPFTEIRAERDEKTGQRRISGVSVRFGSIPEYGWEGEGLLLGGTSENSPAERAGLLRGDIISQVGDIEVLNIYDFMFALQTYKAGDVVLVRFQRDDTEQSVRLTLEAKALE
ncbi:MAG: hypothetical protein CMJ87_09795 [Planctomycetes bacterium]|nr:hypothetical protein [Planctomycetota bacterium]